MTGYDILCQSSISEVSTLLRSGAASPRDLTEAMLARITSLGPALGCYVTVVAERARQQAIVAEREIALGHWRGPLHGIPMGIKDIFYTRGIPTGVGSKILADWVPTYDAHVVERLDDAGAVLLGKHVMTEFAFSGYHPDFDPPRNPWNADRWSGVSSSGSAVAVASCLSFGSFGTDTGGSIRYPAAVNGIVGIKPTFGRISRYGVFPFADSLDHVGAFARSVEDAAILLDAVAGRDRRDPLSLRVPVERYRAATGRPAKGLAIGYDEGYCARHASPEVADAIADATIALADAGARIVPVNIAALFELCGYFSLVAGAEALLAHVDTFPSRRAEMGPAFAGLLDACANASAIDLARAQAVWARVAARLDGVFDSVDILCLPSMGVPAPTLEEVAPQPRLTPEAMAEYLAFTAPFNFSGHPTISLPCGLSSGGLPLSLQLVGRATREVDIITAAAAFERATKWHTLRPPLPEVFQAW
ncbi:MAG: amidase [Alphaproteobacteria bacterium]|nr:MAG: amidase [Alphaproteobacteria bacterium]